MAQGVAVDLGWGSRDDRDVLLVTVTGGDAAAPAEISVYPASPGAGDTSTPRALLQPMAGRCENDGESILFVPRYPFVPGTPYTVRVRVGTEVVERTIGRPPATVGPPTTSVVAIRPALGEVPRNVLRMYVEFSAPMSDGDAARCLSVVATATGQPLQNSFLAMDPELWDPARTRLTVFFDPARIKRGLAPHLDAGYPLVEGTSVDVVIDASFRDATGLSLAAPARRAYRVGRDLRGRVDPASWTIVPPTVRGREPLCVDFDRPLDVGLLAHCITVGHRGGPPLAGWAEPADDGRSWTFVPEDDWRAGLYTLRVAPILEDVAGNSVCRVFDRDLSDRADDPSPPAVIEVGYVIDD